MQGRSRENWLARRKHGIGGSEIAAIIGAHPYKTPLDVYLSKVGPDEDKEPTDAMEWGVRLEPVVMAKFAERHPEYKREQTGSYDLQQGVEEWEIHTPDDLLTPNAGLEIKTVGLRQAERWGDEDSDHVPQEALIQCHWGMVVCKRTHWYLAALIGGQEYREYRFDYDAELAALLKDEARKFWEDYVLKGVAPPVDGSEASKKYLDAKYPSTTGNVPVATAGAFLTILDEYQSLRALMDQAKDRRDLLESQIKEQIGSDDGVLWSGGKITWKRPKDSVRTDWKGICSGLDIPKEVMAANTTTKVNSRRFLAKFQEVENEQLTGEEPKELPGS